jgi:hypothetical protein
MEAWIIQRDAYPAYLSWMVCSQLTIQGRGTTKGENVPDFYIRRVDNDAIDEQLDELTLAGKGGRLQPTGECSPEALELRGDRLQVRITLVGGSEGALLTLQLGQATLQLTAAGLEFVQRQGACHIRVHQALDLAAQLRLTSAERRAPTRVDALI